MKIQNEIIDFPPVEKKEPPVKLIKEAGLVLFSCFIYFKILRYSPNDLSPFLNNIFVYWWDMNNFRLDVILLSYYFIHAIAGAMICSFHKRYLNRKIKLTLGESLLMHLISLPLCSLPFTTVFFVLSNYFSAFVGFIFLSIDFGLYLIIVPRLNYDKLLNNKSIRY